jgi:hypothetical protein
MSTKERARLRNIVGRLQVILEEPERMPNRRSIGFKIFRRWYPDSRPSSQAKKATAKANFVTGLSKTNVTAPAG